MPRGQDTQREDVGPANSWVKAVELQPDVRALVSSKGSGAVSVALSNELNEISETMVLPSLLAAELALRRNGFSICAQGQEYHHLKLTPGWADRHPQGVSKDRIASFWNPLPRVEVAIADITKIPFDAIVNSANASLLAGSGISGAIHRAAGPALEEAAKRLGRCHAGDAVTTAGFDLPSKYVIHAVGPRWEGGGKNERVLLQQCYLSICREAVLQHFETLAIPSISTGVYGFPLQAAAEIAIRTVFEFGPSNCRIVFACASQEVCRAYQDQVDGILGTV